MESAESRSHSGPLGQAQGPEGRRILIVDDDPSDAELCSTLLMRAKHPWEVTVVASVPDAASALERSHFDGVLLDYTLDGAQATAHISRFKHMADDPCLPIVVMYCTGDEERIVRSLGREAADYVSKQRFTSASLDRDLSNAIARARLARLLSSESENLKLANDELKRQTREIRSFYHGVSHELKTPLTAIREFCSLVADGVLGEVNSDQEDVLRNAVGCCDQLNRMVNDLFDVARLETGKLSLSPQWVDFSALLKRELQVLEAKAEKHDVRLVAKVSPEVALVRCDSERISQVMFNLVGNAIKYSAKGGSIEVSASLNASKSMVNVEVCDSGCGIPTDQLEVVFEKLYQIEPPAEAQSPGMGVGLFICKQIVELHGGDITVESQLDRGSCFRFQLPVGEPVEHHDHQELRSDVDSNELSLIVAEGRQSA